MNLVIGKSSQLAQYFPDDYEKISSRNIDLNYLKNNNWNSVYITFAEQRIYDKNIDFITPNYIYTLQLIDSLLHCSNKIVCYTSCELWNNLSGFISKDTIPNFHPITNEYSLSKLLLLNKIKERQKIDIAYNKVIFMHPFYFNSTYRNEYFLFGKIFDSIIYKKKINVGNLNFYRDMVHASYVVKQSINATKDLMIGSGKLFNVRDFIKDLYLKNNMNYEDYVNETSKEINRNKLIMADTNAKYTYEDLLSDTQSDILSVMEKQNGNFR